jgi:hypothetical protein
MNNEQIFRDEYVWLKVSSSPINKCFVFFRSNSILFDVLRLAFQFSVQLNNSILPILAVA